MTCSAIAGFTCRCKIHELAIEIARDATREPLVVLVEHGRELAQAIRASAGFSSCGFAHTVSTGVLTASGSP